MATHPPRPGDAPAADSDRAGSSGSADPAPHVLYVAWGFPPSRGGGVYRALATANAFAREGFRVTVLTASRETFVHYTGADFSLEEQIDPGIEVVRIPFEWPAMETDLRKWPALRAWAPALWRRRQLQRDIQDFPEIGYGPWATPLAEAALAIHRRDPVDLCVATANPNVDFVAAQALHRSYGVPYVMDYRDAWMLDVFDGAFVHEEGGRVDTRERGLLNEAHEVWFVNEPIRAWHQQRHLDVADRMHVVANGYDPQFAPDPVLAAPDAGEPLRFGYLGTASAKVPLQPFAQGWRMAREQGGDLAGATAELWGYLGYYSAPSPALLNLVEEYTDDGLSYRGPVPKAEVPATYATFDALLLILGAGRYVTSGKVFEYTASALPIVAVHDPSNAATDVLRDYPLWFPVTDLEPASIADALTQAAHAARNADEATREACREFSRRYRRDLQLLPRVHQLRAELANRLAEVSR